MLGRLGDLETPFAVGFDLREVTGRLTERVWDTVDVAGILMCGGEEFLSSILE